MNRYNQGFGKFGPMEQEWNGKWVKYEDVIPLENTIKELRQQNASLDHTIDVIETKCWDWRNKSENWFALFCSSMIINAVLAYIIVFIR